MKVYLSDDIQVGGVIDSTASLQSNPENIKLCAGVGQHHLRYLYLHASKYLVYIQKLD